jgi:hypothetical protein
VGIGLVMAVIVPACCYGALSGSGREIVGRTSVTECRCLEAAGPRPARGPDSESATPAGRRQAGPRVVAVVACSRVVAVVACSRVVAVVTCPRVVAVVTCPRVVAVVTCSRVVAVVTCPHVVADAQADLGRLPLLVSMLDALRRPGNKQHPRSTARVDLGRLPPLVSMLDAFRRPGGKPYPKSTCPAGSWILLRADAMRIAQHRRG